jgi:integrase
VPPYRAAIFTLAMTGIRAGELLALQWQEIDFLERRITIARSLWRRRFQTPKTEASKRTLRISPEIAQVLLEHRQASTFTAPDDFVFCQLDGRPIDPDSLRTYGIYAALEKAEHPVRKRASGCHAFRHLPGSIIHRKTGSVKLAQKQLGHSNVATTGDIHTHVDDDEMDGTAQVLGEAFSGIGGRNVVETVRDDETVQ